MRYLAMGCLIVCSACSPEPNANGHAPRYAVSFSTWDKSVECPERLSNERPDSYARRIYSTPQSDKDPYFPPNIKCLEKHYSEEELRSFSKLGDIAASYYTAIDDTLSEGDMCKNLTRNRGKFLYVIEKSEQHPLDNSKNENYFPFAESAYLFASINRNCDAGYRPDEMVLRSKKMGFDSDAYNNSRGE